MKKKWEGVEVINLRDENFEAKAYEQIIEEVAGIVYSGLCQLHKKSLSDSFNSEDQLLERTGTDA